MPNILHGNPSARPQQRRARLDDLIGNERAANREGRGSWDLYAGHRDQVTRAILDLHRGDGRVCLLGAGNCNDVDLARIAARYREVILVDIDAAALAGAIDRHGAEVRARLRAHAPIDLSGLVDVLDVMKRPSAEADQVVAEAARKVASTLPGPFDVVVSGCVMTQLAECLRRAVPGDDIRYHWLRDRVMVIHLRTLATLAGTGGCALLINDVTSSEHVPVDTLAAEDQIGSLAADGLCFAASNPLVVRRHLRHEPELVAAFSPARALPTWLWNARFDRTFLVQALVLERRPLLKEQAK